MNPIQTSAENMDTVKLKKEFGKYLVFWGGGIDTREVLPRGTPESVKEDVRKRLEVFSKDGGYVFNTIHNILADVPPENIIAMFDEVNNFNQ